MTLSADKTLVTHIDTGFDFLGFHIQRKPGRGGRIVVITYPSKPVLATVTEKIKRATSRGTTSGWLTCFGFSTRFCVAGQRTSSTPPRKRPSPTSGITLGGG